MLSKFRTEVDIGQSWTVDCRSLAAGRAPRRKPCNAARGVQIRWHRPL